MNPICLVHLVRASNGLRPFQEFLQAYRKCPGGIEHDLLLVLKGFASTRVPEEYRKEAGDLRYTTLFIRDVGYDIRAYGVAARRKQNAFFCFLNSFSRPLDPDWLLKLFLKLRTPSVGLVGATGSWESMYSNLLFPPHPENRTGALQRLWRPFRLALCRSLFPPFPNWHIRTNALMLSRELILRFWPRIVPAKRSAYLFENGKRSLTRHVLEAGLNVLVVGKDGRGYSKEDWVESRTYRIGDQENLLVADTQTTLYEHADATTRQYLSRLAWGAQPAIGTSP